QVANDRLEDVLFDSDKGVLKPSDIRELGPAWDRMNCEVEILLNDEIDEPDPGWLRRWSLLCEEAEGLVARFAARRARSGDEGERRLRQGEAGWGGAHQGRDENTGGRRRDGDDGVGPQPGEGGRPAALWSPGLKGRVSPLLEIVPGRDGTRRCSCGDDGCKS